MGIHSLIRSILKASHSIGSLLVFCLSQDLVCSEPRDIIYGLLGIARNVKDGDIVCDYNKPVREVYRDLLAFFISKGTVDDFGVSTQVKS
jgi:hypothetical protein